MSSILSDWDGGYICADIQAALKMNVLLTTKAIVLNPWMFYKQFPRHKIFLSQDLHKISIEYLKEKTANCESFTFRCNFY